MTKAAAKANGMAALRAKMAGQTMGFHTGPQTAEVYAQKPTNIVTAGNGVFRVIQKDIGAFITKLADGKIPGLPEMQEGVELAIPKIPYKYWLQVLSFYKDVNAKDGTEASVIFFWNTNNVQIPTHYDPTPAQAAKGELGPEVKGLTQDGQLIIYCPVQKNSGSLSDFTKDSFVDWLRLNTAQLLETHSHNTMGAFWSGTDDSNENYPQFYGVMGKVSSPQPEYRFRYALGKEKFDCELWELFEKPQVKMTETVIVNIPGVGEYKDEQEVKNLDFNGPWPMVEYPDDWMGQHSKSVYTPTYTTPYQRKTYGAAGTQVHGGAGGGNFPSLHGSEAWGDGWGDSGYWPGVSGQSGLGMGAEVIEGDFGYGEGTRQGQESFEESYKKLLQEPVAGQGTWTFAKAWEKKVSEGQLETDGTTVDYVIMEPTEAEERDEIHALIGELINFGTYATIVDIARDEHLVE
ncbi:hypothetical protein_gp215 [Bacillus phage vB_BceM_WH1]|nr:hypothetical protein_gp215 [Bacillus phage vB_BceM_WH1]